MMEFRVRLERLAPLVRQGLQAQLGPARQGQRVRERRGRRGQLAPPVSTGWMAFLVPLAQPARVRLEQQARRVRQDSMEAWGRRGRRAPLARRAHREAPEGRREQPERRVLPGLTALTVASARRERREAVIQNSTT